ncbi:MAG: hypothetical protein R3E83_04410 [Burkholderiaceae bacterium]
MNYARHFAAALFAAASLAVSLPASAGDVSKAMAAEIEKLKQEWAANRC